MLNVSFFQDQAFFYETDICTVPFDAEKVNYRKPSFFSKFFELQAVMWRTNAGLTERHAYDSRPQHWPVLRRGIVSHSLLELECKADSEAEFLGTRSSPGIPCWEPGSVVDKYSCCRAISASTRYTYPES